MHHARQDYETIQDIGPLLELAIDLLSMEHPATRMKIGEEIARRLLGIGDAQLTPKQLKALPCKGTSIEDNEPVFVIRAQDITSEAMLEHWINLARKAGASYDILEKVSKHAELMAKWKKKKTPDL